MSGPLEHLAILDRLGTLADRVWPVLLFLALIQVVADLCDDAGLFDVSAHVAARLGRGSRLGLFGLFVLLATLCTWLLSIDTTAVLLTPIGLALAAELGLRALPFAFASIWLANSASLLLPVSNLTNLLAQGHLGLSPLEFLRATWLPQLAVLVAVVAVLLLRFGTDLRGRYVVPSHLPAHDPVLLWLSVVVVALVGPAVLFGVPAWLVALLAGATLVAGFVVRRPERVRPGRLLRLVPWTVIVFAVVLFVVLDLVFGSGGGFLGSLVGSGGDGAGSLARWAATSSVAANLTNNLPAYLALEPLAHSTDQLVALLVGVNVGPMVLVWGSLANLLWLRSCRARGLQVSAWSFAREGLLVVPVSVAAGVLVLVVG